MAPPQNTRKIDMDVLIREIKKRPILWDVHCEAFKNRTQKNEAWTKLCDAVYEDDAGISDAEKALLAQELMLRWKSTRDNFIRSVRKQEQANNRNRGRKRNIRKVYQDDKLGFLLKNRKPRFPDRVAASITIKPDISELCETEDSMEQEVEEPIYVDVAGGLLHEQFEATQESGSPLNYSTDVFENITEAPAITATSELFSDPRSRSYCPGEHIEEAGSTSQASVVTSSKTISEDEHFFHSMLPSVLKLSATEKMKFRIKVMQALLEVKESR